MPLALPTTRSPSDAVISSAARSVKPSAISRVSFGGDWISFPRSVARPVAHWLVPRLALTEALSGRLDVGLRKIGALKHQGFTKMAGAGIGETVSEIEPRRVASLAIAVEGVECDAGGFRRHVHDFDFD